MVMFPPESDLHGAVARGEIIPFFQPQVDLATREPVAVEVLCRWIHPKFGQISPAEFIPVAEANGAILDIGTFMLEETCRAAAEWHSDGYPLEVSVNVSPIQLAKPDFFDVLLHNLESLGLPPQTLTIEITESLPISDLPMVVSRLASLRDLGLGVSIDDFGTGYSSIAQLQSLPATELKIDQSLVQDESQETQALMTAVVGVVRSRGIRIVAEGVETEQQLQRVLELGCDRAQGYLFSKPVPREAADALVQSR
jgi:EAL domain-containing protein (putative c-di-GMP-specific phosphodiesterase class I)